uniref:Metalloendopeptidase n=1 Tax=Globodera rostochiensis TaxID=31243 RepID=A0A914HUX5_GLORO
MELHSAFANEDGTNRCKKKCAFLATALPVQHYGIKCTQIVFPADIAQMTLNVIISSPYEEACLKPYELFVCFKSWILNKKISADANLILQKCRAHFGQDSDGTAGFRMHICTRRDVDQLIIESIEDEIGALLASIAYDLVNGSEAKQLHFIPNFGEHIHIFFQIPGLGFSKRITQNWNLDGYQNDPKKSYKPVSICDLLDDDCVPVRELMAKISAYQNWCDPDNPSDPCIDPPIQDTGTEMDPLDRMGDKIKSKEQVQSLHEKYRISEDATCVNFTFIVSAGKDYGINITNGEGCSSSSLGKKGGWQKLTLASECIEDNGGIAAHELLHALGLDHEHQRNDARNFTKINYYHEEYKDWASQLVVEQNTGNFDFPYDYGSIMHYPSVGPAPHLIITHSRFYQKTIGQSVKLSFKDAAIIDHAYCKDACKNEANQCLNNGYPNPKRCLQCRCPDGYGGAYCESIENNRNCIYGNERELEADWQTRTLKPLKKQRKTVFRPSLIGAPSPIEGFKRRGHRQGINGQYKEVRGLNKPKEAYFQCFKREGESTSFWGYWNDKSKDPMYVDDFQCLTYEEAGIEHPPEETSIQFPLKFKSAYDNQSVEGP